MSNFDGQSPKEHSCMIISKSTHWLFLQKSFKAFFLFIALVAILFNGAEPFEQFWKRVSQGWLVGWLVLGLTAL